jgi:hypothetical protein
MRRRVLAVLVLCLLAPGLAGWVSPGEPGDVPKREDFPVDKAPVLAGTFLTFFLWQNDRDFDATKPIFDEYGQSVGYVDVRVFPRLAWRPTRAVTFLYFAEIGGALWSRKSESDHPDLVVHQPVYIQKELWAQVLLPWEGSGFRLGFQYIHDPTLLFLEKYVGAFTGFYRWEGGTEVRLVALQVPDTVYEGIEFGENNFQNDDFVFAADALLRPREGLRVKPGLYFRWDRTDVARPRYLWNPCVNVGYDFGKAGFWELDAALQTGFWENRSIDNRRLDLLAGAVQIHGRSRVAGAVVETNLLALSPDGDPYNGADTGFSYSGFSRSRTLLLSQNWILDQHNNLDRKAAEAGAGLFLADLFVRVPVATGLDVFGVLGYGMALEPRHVLGGRTIGTEVDAGLFWTPYPGTRMMFVGGAVFPGRAGAALQNEIDLAACDPIYYFQAALAVTF